MTEGNMLKAVLFKSQERFDSFKKRLDQCGIDVVVLDFNQQGWIDFDYTQVDFAIYYPSFENSSSHPLSLYKPHDNLIWLAKQYPHLEVYPDPKVIPFYNDKYRQFLFLRRLGYPIADTIPLFSEEAINVAEEELGYPMIIKNRFGAGGGAVFQVQQRDELEEYYKISKLDLWSPRAARFLAKPLFKRIFYYNLIKARQMPYPFLSPPLLAQRFITHDCDLKTVIGDCKVVEAHWRRKAHGKMWKVNIDDGGVGEWSYVPEEAIDLSVRLARDLKASWLNIDLMVSNGRFLVSEFSPVWHHYTYKEKPSFVYKDDYNIDTPLDVSLDLERIIVESLIKACKAKQARNSGDDTVQCSSKQSGSDR